MSKKGGPSTELARVERSAAMEQAILFAELVGSVVSDKIAPDKDLKRITFTDFATQFIELYSKPRKKSWETDVKLLKRYLLPVFANTLVCDITTMEVLGFHSGLSHASYQANRALELLSVMFRQARMLDFFPSAKRLPTDGIRPYQEIPRDRFLSASELERLATAINRLMAHHLRVLFWLYLLTGLRKTELLSVKWRDIDFERNELYIPHSKTKNSKKLYLPLSQEALSLFMSLPRRSEYVFPGSTPGSHLQRYERAWNQVREDAGLPDVRLHDLRRTVASWMAQSGQPLSLIGKCLNHSSAKATEIYARFSNHDVRAALNAHGEAINDFMGDMSVVTRSTKEEQLQFKILERLSDGAKRQSLLRSVLYVRMDVLEQALCALEVAGKIKQRTEVINGRDSIFWRLIAPGEESTSLCTEMIRRHVPLVESRSRNSLTPEQRLEHRIIRALRVGINRQRSLYTSLKISSSELGTALTRMEKQGIVIRYTETGDNKRLCTCWRLAEKDEIGVAVDPANN